MYYLSEAISLESHTLRARYQPIGQFRDKIVKSMRKTGEQKNKRTTKQENTEQVQQQTVSVQTRSHNTNRAWLSTWPLKQQPGSSLKSGSQGKQAPSSDPTNILPTPGSRCSFINYPGKSLKSGPHYPGRGRPIAIIVDVNRRYLGKIPRIPRDYSGST